MATRTAVVAGTATAVSGRVSRRQAAKYDQQAAAAAPPPQQYEAPPQYAPPPPQYAPPPAPEDDSMAKVQQLAQLHAQGILSDEEFAAAKAKALGI
jgi:hypothetical protein